MLHCFLFLVFDCHTTPYETRYMNIVRLLNEYNVLVVGYLALGIIYSIRSVEMRFLCGRYIVIVILLGVVINLVLVAFFTLKNLKLKGKNIKKQHVIRHRKRELKKYHRQESIARMKFKMHKLHSKSVVLSAIKKKKSSEKSETTPASQKYL